ncbi:MAG: dihydropteroate synthase [Candidatus Latescibacteria bacterium]|jgi:5-methyltetrahydrofolate--homocysteine methyltransferase|nr:dihydropteroate synthase [Candidatus Latescibacterota bacterium]
MIVIGENVNATRKWISKAIRARDDAAIQAQIRAQDEAGADFIDLNAGTGADAGEAGQETEDLCWLIDVALGASEKALSIDSADPDVIRSAADHLGDRRPWMMNSVKSEETILEALLPLAASNDVPVVALAMDAGGIPQTVEQRLAACRDILSAAERCDVRADQLYFDPLVMPLSANYAHGQVALDTLRELKTDFPDAKATVGASNVSFGLPNRKRINAAFLIAAVACGLDSAICDPTDRETRDAVLLGELVVGKDRHCRRFTRAVRRGEFQGAQ